MELNKELSRAVELVSEHTFVSPDEILSKDRHHEIVMARHLAITIAYRKYKAYGLSTLRLGEFFRRDHSSILHSLRAVQDMVDTDMNFKKLYNAVMREYSDAKSLSVNVG